MQKFKCLMTEMKKYSILKKKVPGGIFSPMENITRITLSKRWP